MTGRTQIVECTPDPNCNENEPGNGTVCPDELTPIYVNQYYDKTLTVIPPATFEGFSIISHIRIDAVHNLPPGVEWGKSHVLFQVTNPITRYCVKLYGTPEEVGEYQLVLEITPFIWGVPSPGGSVEDDTSFLLIVLPQILAPEPAFTSNVTQAPTNTDVFFTDQSSNNPSEWLWQFQSGNPSSSTQQNPAVQWSAEGVYDVSLTVANAGGDNSITIENYITIVDDPSYIAGEITNINIYPNPAINKLNVEAENIKFVEIIDINGRRLLFENENTAGKAEIDISKLNPGSYFLIVVTEFGSITRNIIIQ